jgi:hypothetical protein
MSWRDFPKNGRKHGVLGISALSIGVAALLLAALTAAQAPARGGTPQQPAGSAQQPAGRSAAAPAAGGPVAGNLAQVMRGIIFPASNVIFAAQSDDFNKIKGEGDPSLSPNLITSTYGGWQAVENSSLALAEAANLLTIPGRRCGNGKPVPLGNADWPKFVQGLRQAGMTSYKAAQSKNQDRMLEAADAVSTACSNCHDVYREKSDAQGGLAARCTK